MSRRGEGQFVCAEVDLINNPRLATMARELRISRVQAFGHLMLWRQFVLQWGSATGVVRDYSLEDVAAYVQWSGRTPKLAAALKAGGFLATRRAALVYPHWLETPTGEYAKNRADVREADRRRKAEWREAQRGEASADVTGDVPRTSVGHPPDVLRDGGDQSIKDVRRTPQGAPQGGAASSASRLEWFEDNYPKGLIEKDKCAALLGALSEGEWSHLQRAIEISSRSIWWRERGRAPKPERWLADQEWKRTKLPKPLGNGARIRKAPKAPEGPSAEDAERMRQAFVRRAEIKHRLKAEGVPQEEIEDRIDRELIDQATVERLPS